MWKAVLCTHRIQRPFCKSLHCSDVAGECLLHFSHVMTSNLEGFFCFCQTFFGGWERGTSADESSFVARKE
jgi:hypothetical protein